MSRGFLGSSFASIFAVVFAATLLSCSTPVMKRTRSTDQTIDKINLLAIRFFRPYYRVADQDDFSQNDREFRCETSNAIWAEQLAPGKGKALIECINSLKTSAHYRYIPRAQPVLAVDDLQARADEKDKLCIYDLLPTLPLPREVYFLATTKKRPIEDIYAISFDTKANQIADATLRAPRFETDLKFPLRQKLETIQDLNIWLTTLVFTLFRDEDQHIKASLVTENLANRCFHDDPLFLDKQSEKIPPVLW